MYICVYVSLFRTLELTDLANEAMTPDHSRTTDATQSGFFLYIGFGLPFALNQYSASASENPLICARCVATITCSSSTVISMHSCIRSNEPGTRGRGLKVTYRHCQCICKSHDGYHNGANLPRQLDGRALVSFGPEEVEEETGAEDRGYGYADEYVV